MTVRILEVNAAAAIVRIDLALFRPGGVRPKREPALLDTPEDLVKLGLANEECKMPRQDLAFLSMKSILTLLLVVTIWNGRHRFGSGRPRI